MDSGQQYGLSFSAMIGQVRLHVLHHCVYALHYHFVLVTKYRRKALTRPMLDRLRAIAEMRWEGWGGQLLECNGESDHVHLLVALPPNLGLSRFVNNLKTTSSRLLRREFATTVARFYRKAVLWSRSYCVITCGGAPLTVPKQYIERQETPE
ncbi:IS200/IS605 family transposase [Methylacidiphilum fumariolicum]|uniref:IS200/IS605 family transposase n=1 Tax=Candidatus Methylacidiphilum fumarolicum TaxID=591154 RepID=UPI001CA4F29F|nr:IS200/IS605 family transposase [Candidatus Methylacidiphilum fumarolicum]MBW6414243.1 IS200/IS605 family transposase [Candidatus Methylacidiphilum fumarolicum]